MFRFSFAPTAYIFIFTAFFGILLFASTALATEPEAVPGQYIIKYATSDASSMRSMRSSLGVRSLKRSALTRAELVQTEKDQEFDHALAKKLLASGEVEYIEPNYIVTTNATPNDSSYGYLWGLHNEGQTGGTTDIDIDAPEAWDLTTGSTEVVVGVVDTGVDYTHPDLAANMWVNPYEIAANGIDDDSNGVVDDVYGYNAITESGDPFDDADHGTHCAGTIGAVGNNGVGVAGINWNVKIMALKFLNSYGSGTTMDAVDAIEYAVNMKTAGVNLKVLSNSWGGGSSSQTLKDAIRAANTAGILFVAAAGNSASNNDSTPAYPANYDVDNVVSVAAIDHNGNLASFSNYGASTVDLAAPGVSIVSTVPGNSYESFSGTSMATPHVSGVAALVAGREPTLSASALKSRLMSTVQTLSTMNGVVASGGMLNALNALTSSTTPAPSPDTPGYEQEETTIDYDTDLGERVLNQDDGYATETLPFTFTYYGQRYSSIAISSNGRILPLADGESEPTEYDYDNSLSQGIHPLHDDLTPSNRSSDGGVWYKESTRSVTITWVMVAYSHSFTSGSAAELRFQAQLFSNGAIEFHYLDSYTGDSRYDYGASASIGLASRLGVSGDTLTVSEDTSNEEEIGNGKALRFEVESSFVNLDFDGDGTSDIMVWRPYTGYWYILTSSSGFDASKMQSYQLGLYGDSPLSGDFDGDKKADLAVWRPSDGTWYFRTSVSGYGTISSLQWGLYGDVPVTGDYDGDGLTDITVYRASAGYYYSLLSSGGYNRSGALAGQSGTMYTPAVEGIGHDPLVGDFTGDGVDDYVTIWQLVRFWNVHNYLGTLLSSQPWGEAGDTPLGCDLDGDSADDRVIVRANESGGLDWYTATASGGAITSSFGDSGDAPRCNRDYDGDGIEDMAVYKDSTGMWSISESDSGSTVEIQFGLPGDIAL